MTEIQTIARLTIHQGKLEEFKRLAAECMEVVRTKDTGTIQYELYFNDDQTECVCLERYRDSESLLQHHKNIGDLMGKLLETCSGCGEVCGDASPELAAQLEGSSVVRLFRPYQWL